MKKQYTFVLLICIILYISFLILSFTYKKYKVNQVMDEIKHFSSDIREQIEESKVIITYKTSRAFKNKILKEQQSRLNKGDVLISFTPEDDFNKYTKPLSEIDQEVQQLQTIEESEIYEMSIYERWMYFLFNKNS